MNTIFDIPHKAMRTKKVCVKIEKCDDELIMVELIGYKPMSLAKVRKLNIRFKQSGETYHG